MADNRKACYNCGWIESDLTFICRSTRARIAYGTDQPLSMDCPYWKISGEEILMKFFTVFCVGATITYIALMYMMSYSVTCD